MIRLLSCFVFLRVSAVQGNAAAMPSQTTTEKGAAAPSPPFSERLAQYRLKKKQKFLTPEALDALTWLKADELTIMARTDCFAQDCIKPHMMGRMEQMRKSPFVAKLVEELRVSMDPTLSESQELLEEYTNAASLMAGADAGAAAAGSVSRT